MSARDNHRDDFEPAEVSKLERKDEVLIRAMILILRGLKAVCLGNPNAALNHTQAALKNNPEMQPKELAVLFWVEGWAYRSLGQIDHAMDVLTRSTQYALESGANLHDTWTDLANVTRLAGNLPQAINILAKSLQMAADRAVQNQGILSRDESFLSFIFLEQNKLDLALAHANRAIAHTQWWPSHHIIATAYTNLAEILLARGDLNGSLTALQRADQERKNRLMTPFIHSGVEAAWVQIWLKQDRWDLLDQWFNSLAIEFDTHTEAGRMIDEYFERRLIMLVRVWLEKTRIDKRTERYENCSRLLARLLQSSQTSGRVNSWIELQFLSGIILFAQGKTSAAIIELEKCLSMAEPAGYMRIFLNTGEPARSLITAYLQQPNRVYKAYALRILKEFGGFIQTNTSASEYPEAITARELEVLRLLAEGFSNQQIAEKLVVAEGTVKFHVHQILGKLQVNSRTQAIVRARDLELI
ncbi:hypothetical protein EG834_09580 [bacterium]|nr:hypothetical protein [bacterium]